MTRNVFLNFIPEFGYVYFTLNMEAAISGV